MKKKFYFLFAILLFSAGSVCSQDPIDIPIICEDDTLDTPRSLVSDIPIVTLSGSELTFEFPSATASQVIIRNQVSNQIVYSDSFSSSTQVQIDLEEENVGEGSYVLWLYAFGRWWWGEFIIEEE